MNVRTSGSSIHISTPKETNFSLNDESSDALFRRAHGTSLKRDVVGSESGSEAAPFVSVGTLGKVPRAGHESNVETRKSDKDGERGDVFVDELWSEIFSGALGNGSDNDDEENDIFDNEFLDDDDINFLQVFDVVFDNADKLENLFHQMIFCSDVIVF
jgi:hypothetical protein